MSSDMEAVNAFNSELSSLYDVKPPISKGKMTSITRAALKAVKLYKHVVQSVEKFIQKCKPEYKIPGLYVIDSIIRQSRHQFGAEKDVFATRFSRNLTTTFVHLYKCPDEDKAKIIRVLNLWQKNKIFMPEVIAPLFDLANPNHAIWETIASQQANAESNNNTASKSTAEANQVHFKKELLDYDYDDDVEPNEKDKNAAQSQPTQLTATSQGLADKIPPNVLSGFDALGSLLANPEVLRQLQTLQEQMAAAAVQQSQQLNQFSTPEQERQRKLAELNKQEAAFEQRLAQTVARLPFAVECEFDPTAKQGNQTRDDKSDIVMQQVQQQIQSQQSSTSMNQLLPPAFFQQLENNPNLASAPPPLQLFDQQGNFGQFGQHLQQPPPQLHQQQELMSQGVYSHFNNFSQQQSQLQQQQQPQVFEDKDREQRPRRRRSRSPVTTDRRKSRSRSRSRSRRRSRSGSRGRSGRRRYTRSRSRERREEREREKERARKGFPPMRKEHLSVCSTTLWVGHLSKLVSQEEISDTFGAYGDIVSIDLISPRGCAFVVMNRRQDALRALDRLKNVKLQGKAITLAWAPGKSVKGREWKDYWEVEQGVSYIPWSKLKPDTNVDDFEDGGCADEDTLPPFLKDRPKINPPSEQQQMGSEVTSDGVADAVKGVPAPSLTPSGGALAGPLLSTPTSVQVLMDNSSQSQSQTPAGDTDARVELNAVAAAAAAAHATGQPLGPPTSQGMVQPFVGLPPQVGLMGMGPQFGMMVPPPMLGGPGGPGPGLQPFGPPPSLLGVMGQGPPGMLGHGAPAGPLGTPNNTGAGLLGDMPIVHQVLQPPMHSNVDMASGSFGSDTEIKCARNAEDEVARPDGQKRKKSRFEDLPQDEKSLDGMSRKDDRVPLHERLKNIAEYGMEGRQSLLGTPRVPPMGGNLMFNNGQPAPITPDARGGRSFVRPLFASPTATSSNPVITPGSQGSSWGFDTSGDASNPFLNPNNPNPFIGNPFVQQIPSSGNPFDLNSSFEDFNSPRPGGRGNWIGPGGPRDTQHSPQKWGSRGDRGGSWGRGDNRREDRFDDSWRGGREGRGHRDSRSGDRSDQRDRDYRGGDRSGGNRDWKDRDGPPRRGRFDRDGPRRSRHGSGENLPANGGAGDGDTPRRNRKGDDWEKPQEENSNDKSNTSWDQKSGKENDWSEGANNEEWDQSDSHGEQQEKNDEDLVLNENNENNENNSVDEQRLDQPEVDDLHDDDAVEDPPQEPAQTESSDQCHEMHDEDEDMDIVDTNNDDGNHLVQNEWTSNSNQDSQHEEHEPTITSENKWSEISVNNNCESANNINNDDDEQDHYDDNNGETEEDPIVSDTSSVALVNKCEPSTDYQIPVPNNVQCEESNNSHETQLTETDDGAV